MNRKPQRQLEKYNFLKIVYPRKNIFRRLNIREIATKIKTMNRSNINITRNIQKYVINYSSSQKGIISYISKIKRALT